MTSGKDMDGRVRVGESTQRCEVCMGDCFVGKLVEGGRSEGRDAMLPAASRLLREGVGKELLVVAGLFAVGESLVWEAETPRELGRSVLPQ